MAGEAAARAALRAEARRRVARGDNLGANRDAGRGVEGEVATGAADTPAYGALMDKRRAQWAARGGDVVDVLVATGGSASNMY